MTARRWAIVGGGLLGSTLALRLAAAGQRVTLFEADASLGGLAAAWQIGDLVWDRHYHVTLLSDSSTRGLLTELGLEREIDWVRSRAGLFDGRSLVSLSNAIDYARLPVLGLIDKARLASTILWASRLRDGLPLEEERVEDWLRRWSGGRVLERLWAPLLRSKLGSRYPEASAAFLWATIRRLYAARRSGLEEERFGYVPGGYARILARLEERLEALGVAVRRATPVREVRSEAAGIVVETREGERALFERGVVTLTPKRTAALVPRLDEQVRSRMRAIGYQGIVCASVLLDEPLAPYYLTYLLDPSLPFTAVVEMSALVAPAQLGGRGLVYLPCYADARDEIFQQSDEAIRETFLTGLKRVHAGVQPDRIQAFRVSRVPEVFPFPVLGYTRQLPGRDLGPGLHWVSSAQIVNGTLNVDETVELAEGAATALLASDGWSSEARAERGAA